MDPSSNDFNTAALSAMGKRSQAPPISWLMEIALQRPNLISLAAGFTDNATLPVAETREIIGDLLANPDVARPALQYGSTPGDPVLRQLTIDRLLQHDRPDASVMDNYLPGRVVMTHGSQQLLYLVTECLFDEGDIVLVEDPTYFVFLGITQSRAIQCRGVRADSDGINIAHLGSVLGHLKQEGNLSRVKALYLVSYCQNPTGVTTSFEKKQAALDMLRPFEDEAGHPIYLIEDAAYMELAFDRNTSPATALAANGAQDRLVLTSTYSKPYASGIRVGYGVLPEALLSTVLHTKTNHDFGTSNFLQQIVARALKSGKYQEHLRTLVARYATKSGWMRSALRHGFPAQVQWKEPAGGLYFWVRLPSGIATDIESDFFRHALENDVLYVPGSLCYAEDPTRAKPNSEMRLSFGSASETGIQEGIARLGRAIRTFIGN